MLVLAAVSQPAVDPTLTVWESVVGLSLICDIINLEITTGIRYLPAQMTLYLSNTYLWNESDTLLTFY